MPATLRNTAGGLWAEQPHGAALDYGFTWDVGSDTIAQSTWTASGPPGSAPLTITNASITGTSTVAFLSGGTAGAWYGVTNTITTAAGRVDRRFFMVLLTTALPAQARSAVFPFPPAAVAQVRRSRLLALANTILAGVTLTDEDIWAKLVAAEAEAERLLRIWLTPREVLPLHPSFDDDAAALEVAGERVAREPGYDYQPDMFMGDRWGMLELRARPIQRVHWVKLAWPNQNQDQASYEIPNAWLRPEGTTNRVSIVPTMTGHPMSIPLNSFILGAIGGGRTVPFMISVAYRAGLTDVRQNHPDICAAVERLATVNVVEYLILPQSGSISADGLSRSMSFDAAKHREEVEDKLAAIARSLQGIRITVA